MIYDFMGRDKTVGGTDFGVEVGEADQAVIYEHVKFEVPIDQLVIQ